MRTKFDEQLELLNRELIEMGSLCEISIAEVTKAISEVDVTLAEHVISRDDEIDEKERSIESLCLKLLLQQQPVARDLRQISTALKLITDLERIGDQAADIAEIVTMEGLSEEENYLHIAEMAKATRKMVTDSIDAFVKRDLELARDVIRYDDVVDALFTKIRGEIIALIKEDSGKGEFALDMFMTAKYFERIGDHATNVAEWVEFSITGVHRSPRHQEL